MVRPILRYLGWINAGMLLGLVGYVLYLKIEGSMTDLLSKLLVLAIGIAAFGTLTSFLYQKDKR